MLGALVVAGLLTVLVMAQLAEVAGSLTGYQTNLQRKIQDIRDLSEGGGAVSRFMAMVASLGHDLALTTGPAAAPAVRVQSGGSNFASVAAFVAPLLHPLLTIGIVVIFVVFILLDRDHLSDQFVRLFGASDVHATSEAIGDAATRVGRVLSLQLLTNFGFAVAVGVGLFALGMPNALLWGLLAGGAALRALCRHDAGRSAAHPDRLRGHAGLGAALPGAGLDRRLRRHHRPDRRAAAVRRVHRRHAAGADHVGDCSGARCGGPSACCCRRRSPSACWCWAGTCRISASCRSCWAHEPALAPYQQIYRRLIRKAVADASTVALAEIEEKGRERGLDDGMGRMVVLAEADRAQDRLSAAQVEAIVEGTDEVLDFIAADAIDGELAAPAAAAATARELHAVFHCVGGRGQIDHAAASIVAFALRQSGLEARSGRRGDKVSDDDKAAPVTIDLICYASHPSDAVRRYTLRKLTLGGGAGRPAISSSTTTWRQRARRRSPAPRARRLPSPAISPRCAGWPRSMP